MKKTLIATSALVAAAGSAAALDLSLNGNIIITADIEVDQSGFNGADWDAGFTFKASGESMGWTYGGTMKFGMFNAAKAVEEDGGALTGLGGDFTGVTNNIMGLQLDAASAYMGADFMGRVMITENCGNFVSTIDSAVGMDAADEVGTISGHCLNWTGMNFGGLELKAAMALDDGSEQLIVGVEYLNPSLGKVDFEFDTISEAWDAEVATVLEGTTLAIGMDYNNNEDNGDGDFDYVVSASGSFGDFKWGAAYSPHAMQSDDTLERDYPGRNKVDGFSAENWDLLTQTGSPTGSGDGFKALGLSLGYDCFSLTLGIDAEGKIDDQYEATLAGANADGFNLVSGLVATGGTLGATEIAILDAITGEDNSFLNGESFAAVGTAQTINGNAGEQGLLAEWEFGMDCELHEGVTVTASLGSESARSVALQQAQYVVSQLEATTISSGALAGNSLSGYTETTALDRSAAMQGQVGIKVTF